MQQNVINALASSANPGYISKYDKFIPGETPVYYSGPVWDHREIEAAINSLVNGEWITTGEKVAEFQDEFAKMFEVKYAHMVNSGSSANLVMFTALKKFYNWQDGAELIVSPVGFPTTIAPIVQNNMKPVFVDIEMNTLNFDVDLIEKAITPKTVAIVVSPVLGNPPDMDRLVALCEQHNLRLIGDNCDSLGSRWKGEHLCKLYDAWSCSFYPAHHISTGEGGMVCTNHDELIKLIISV